MRWNELSTTDPDAAIAFYTRHFGWRQEGEMDMGEMGEYQFLDDGEMMIGAMMPKMPQMPVSLWTYYIGVDDIDRAAEAIGDGGGTDPWARWRSRAANFRSTRSTRRAPPSAWSARAS